jgi:hypothetical protein
LQLQPTFFAAFWTLSGQKISRADAYPESISDSLTPGAKKIPVLAFVPKSCLSKAQNGACV